MSNYLTFRLVLFCGLCIALFFLQTRMDLAFGGSSADVEPKEVCVPRSLIGGYDWLSKNKIVYFSKSSSNYDVVSFDYLKNEQLQLTNVNAALKICGVSSSAAIEWALSPDKAKILIASANGTNGSYFVVDIEDGRLFRPSLLSAGFRFSWKPDSSGWAESFRTNGGTIVRLFELNAVRDFADVIISADIGTPLGFDSHGNLICISSVGNPEITVSKLQLLRLPNRATLLRKRNIIFQTDSTIQEFFLFPNGNKIAWLLKANNRRDGFFCLWITDVDGNDKSEIGPFSDEDLGWIRYNADVKALSFFSNNKIFLIPKKTMN